MRTGVNMAFTRWFSIPRPTVRSKQCSATYIVLHDFCLTNHAHVYQALVGRARMSILQVRDIDDRIYKHLKRLSRQNKRSLSQEVIHIIETYLTQPQITIQNSTDEFLKLSGSWEDERTAEEIAEEIRQGRSSNRRFAENNGLFD